MNVSLQIERTKSGVYVQDAGHTYELAELDRIIYQLQVARRWLSRDRATRGIDDT